LQIFDLGAEIVIFRTQIDLIEGDAQLPLAPAASKAATEDTMVW
jgi:hypothetical protein